jgi:hypothetical protein
MYSQLRLAGFVDDELPWVICLASAWTGLSALSALSGVSGLSGVPGVSGVSGLSA